MGDQQSKIKGEKTKINKSKTVDMTSSSVKNPNYEDRTKKSSSNKKTYNNCPEHDSEQISYVCLLSHCKALMCSKCALNHQHKKKEELSTNLREKYRLN